MQLKIGKDNIKCLIDTGSSTSLLDNKLLSQYKREKLETPIQFNTINGQFTISEEIITPLPVEFNEDSLMVWKLTSFENKKFNALIGQNILKPLNAIVNLGENFLKINNIKTYFIDSCPFDENDIHSIEKVDPNTILAKLLQDDMNSQEKKILKEIINKNTDLFFEEGQNLTHTHEIQHEIVTTVDKPVYTKIYRYPQIHEEEIDRQIKEMMAQGIIKESNSPYNSPLWIVPKKLDNSGKKKWRIVVDYRALNEITISDKFPIPNADSISGKLGRAAYFSTIDLAKGFHQILIKECDRKKTAFSTPLGHYEFIRMPFGLKNAPATFQRLMNSVLRGYINNICVVYLDDILIFSTSLEEHKNNVQLVFNRLRENNLKIEIDKCKFFAKSTEYLGHIMTTEGFKPNPNKIEAIQKLKLPETAKQIKSFLGATGYYRKFIKDYAKIAFGMTKYLKKGARINTKDPQYMDAFYKLKRLLTEEPILRYPDFNKKFKVTTDASNFAIGAVLSQDGHPICYASRTLNEHEKKYSTAEKELLAIVWAVNYFRPYVYGRKFDLLTDHLPLKWLQTKYRGKDINPRLQRWLLKLGEYDIVIEYIKGKENTLADFLSRLNSEYGEICLVNQNSEEYDIDNISTMATIHSQEEESNDHFPILDTVVNRFQNQIILCEHKIKETEVIDNKRKIYISRDDINSGSMIDIFRKYLKGGKVGIFTELSDSEYNVVQLKLIEMYNKSIKFCRCAFHAKDMGSEDEAYRYISRYHKNETGHAGINENYNGLKSLIFIKNLKTLIQKFINNCDVCNRVKYDRKPIKPHFHISETPNDMNEIVHTDTFTISKHNFITFIDKFSKFAVALPLENRNSITLVEKLRLFFSLKGKPKKLIADNEFNCVNVKNFLESENVAIHFTKANSHTGNSDIERFHSTIGERMRIASIEDKELSTHEKMFKNVEFYNKSFHSTVKARPLDIVDGKIDKKKIIELLEKTKEKVIQNRNKTRETYQKVDNEGYARNYKALRHKEEPRYRHLNIENTHPVNIKRKNKFSGQLDTSRYNGNILVSGSDGNLGYPTNQ